MKIVILVLALSSLFAPACGVIRSEVVDDGIVPSVTPKRSDVPMPVYTPADARPKRAAIPMAHMGIMTNDGRISPAVLASAERMGREVGADFVTLGDESESRYVGTVSSFSGGMGMSAPVVNTIIYGWAWRVSESRIGTRVDPKSSEVLDITPGSPADKAGLKITDVVLAIDGARVRGDWRAWYRALANLKPNQAVPLEVIAKGTDSPRTLQLVPEPND